MKTTALKYICILLFAFLIYKVNINAQTDSAITYITREFNLTYNNHKLIIDSVTNKKEILTEEEEIYENNKIIINDSTVTVFSNDLGKFYKIKLNDVHKLSFIKSSNYWLGAGIGAGVGAVLGFAISRFAVHDKGLVKAANDWTIALSTLGSLVVGGVIGGFIGSEIPKTQDFYISKIREDRKRTELIKIVENFKRNNKKNEK